MSAQPYPRLSILNSMPMMERAKLDLCDTGWRKGSFVRAARTGNACAATLFLLLAVSVQRAHGSTPAAALSQHTTLTDHTASRYAANTGTIFGVVRNSVTGDVLAGASIDGGDGRGITTSDSTGVYTLHDVAPGSGQIRVVLDGYYPLTIGIDVPSGGTVRIDILLTPETAVLAPLHIVSPAVTPPAAAWSGVRGRDRLGVWRWSGNSRIAATATGEPDVFHMLTDDPNVTLRPDDPAIGASRIGTAGETLVMLDGLPVWSPVHIGGGRSVITPDAVDGLTFHDGIVPAQYGGRLGNALDVHTRGVESDSVSGSVSVGSVASRVMLESPIHVGSMSGGALFAVRRSNSYIFPNRGTSQPFLARWEDGVGAFSLAHAATALRFLALNSRDRMEMHGALYSTSNAVSDTGGAAYGEHEGTTSAPVAASTTPTTDSTLFHAPWETTTLGMIWTQRLAPSAHLETRIWRAEFHADAKQSMDSVTSMLDNGVRQLGAVSQLIWGGTTLGTSIETIKTHYSVNSTTHSSQDSAGTQLSGEASASAFQLRSAPALFTAFAEQRWGSTDGPWLAQTGLRATRVANTLDPAPVYLDPRASLAVRIGNAVTVTAGYARTHQFVQSLRNQSAPLSALTGIDLPVAAGAGGVPVARGDVVTVGAAAQLGPHARLNLGAYTRWLSGLAIPDSTSSYLFADQRFQVATGRATGAGVALAGQSGVFAWQTMYGVSHMRYSAPQPSTLPAAALSQIASTSLTARLDRLTQCRAVMWGATGPQAPQSTWFDQLPGGESSDRAEGEIEQSHEVGRTLGQTALGGVHTPPYMRFDLHLMHDWPTGFGRGTISSFLTVANVFNHLNVATYGTTSSGRAAQTITLTPRSLLAGVTWRY